MVDVNPQVHWANAWQEGTMEFDKDSIDWIKSRPENIRDLLIRFPPSCIVRATRSLVCPAPGDVGIITSYSEPDEKYPNGTVSVRASPYACTRAQCDPEWLTVVGYYQGITPEVIKMIFDDLNA